MEDIKLKKIATLIFALSMILAFSQFTNAQYSMGGNSYMTGYGQVYGSFGYAMATQNLYNSIQWQIRELQNKELEKQAAKSKTGGKSVSTKSNTNSSAQVSSAPKFSGRFKPDASINVAKTLSEIFETPDEQKLMKSVIEAVQQEYKKESAARGWGNDLAGGLTFFLVSMSMVYHNTDDPSDATVKNIYDVVNLSLDDSPEFAKASNKDKHKLNDMLVGFSALPLLTLVEGKQNGDAETIKTAKMLAGEMIKLVLKTDPENVRFDDKAMKIEKN